MARAVAALLAPSITVLWFAVTLTLLLCSQGKQTWIGTTEAATLLRQFGVRARVVDFVGAHRRGTASRASEPHMDEFSDIALVATHLSRHLSGDSLVVAHTLSCLCA